MAGYNGFLIPCNSRTPSGNPAVSPVRIMGQFEIGLGTAGSRNTLRESLAYKADKMINSSNILAQGKSLDRIINEYAK